MLPTVLAARLGAGAFGVSGATVRDQGAAGLVHQPLDPQQRLHALAW